MKWIVGLACALVLVPTLAAAQPKSAEEWFNEGSTQYNLGNFDAAIEAFKQGFAAEPVERKQAAYLFNIAQSYRQKKDCSQAQFFYKRFLALKDRDTVKPLSAQERKDVEDRIRELEACAREQEAIRNRPPDSTLNPEDPPTETTPPPPTTAETTEESEEEEVDPEEGITARIGGQPRVLSARFAAGGSKVVMGDLDVPLQATFGLTGGYPLPLNDKATLEVGVGFRFTRVQWDAMATSGKTGTASLTAVLANGAVTYEVAPKMAVRGDLGLGMLFFGGASESPFTNANATDGGALAMFHVRAGAAFDYAITPNIVATVPLALSFSPKKEGLAANVMSFDFMVGLGYRM